MEAETTTSESRTYTEQELREAGASALYIAYYNVASAKASARSEVERGPFTLDELNNTPRLGGGFFKALWTGDETAALRRADSSNAAILEVAIGKTAADTFN
jgi:hypothetical protein